MKFTVTLNGSKAQKEIPTSWEQVTFKIYMDLVDCPAEDYTKILSVLTGVETETLEKARIAGLDEVISALSFMRTEIPQNLPKYILGYKIPKNLEFETTGQFKDSQQILSAFKTVDNKITKEDLAKYVDITAIYAMPNYCEARPDEQEEFAKQFWQAPCGEVLAIGNFTLLKSIALNLTMRPDLEGKIGLLRRLRLGIKIFRLNTGSSIRFWLLKRRLTKAGMNF